MKKFFNHFTKPYAVGSLWFADILLIALSILSTNGMAESCIHSQSDAPGKCRVLSESTEIAFPFDVFRGDIRFQCEINGHKVYMLLDDGYMWDDLLFWGGPRVDSLGFRYDGSTKVGGGAGDGERILSKTTSGIIVRLPNVEFTDQRAVITPASSGTGSMWFGSEGQISAMFFKHFVVEINFDKMMITLIKPENFEYRGEGAEVVWKPIGFGPLSIPATLVLADGREITLELLMDLGYNDQLQLWAGKEHDISAPDRSLPASLGINIQGIQTNGTVGRLPRIVIGGYEIKDVLVAYVALQDSKKAMAEAMIGLGLLSRFNLTFDYSRQRLIVKPNSKFDEAFEYNMSGLSMRKNLDGLFDIGHIYDNSPASMAGLQEGDRVISIDGKPAVGFDFFELQSLMRQEGKTIRLVAYRDGRQWEVYLILRKLI